MPMTPEEIKSQKEVVEKRVAELKSYEGKTFMRNDGVGSPIKILGYAGVGVNNGVSFHMFQAETHGARWTPPCTQFLADHHEVEPVEKTQIQKEIL